MGMHEMKEPCSDALTVDETRELWGHEAREAMRSLVTHVSVAATLPAAAICNTPHNTWDSSSITTLPESKNED